jgi:NADH:ubiquinone oxidoreductase subunit E
MPSDHHSVEIVACYGTSCFARGNAENLDLLNAYAQQPGSNVAVRLTGRLCQGECMDGPNLMIGGKLHHGVTAARLRELLQQLGAPLGVDHGTA